MKILVCEPGKHPYTKEISGELDSLQQTVGGYIQAIYPFDDPIALVCEEEALFHSVQKWNRPVEHYGLIKGTFFLCGLGDEDFTDLTPELTEKYAKHFWEAYDFLQIGNRLIPIPLDD